MEVLLREDSDLDLLPRRIVTSAQATAEKALAPLWLVGAMPEESKANVRWAWFTVQGFSEIDYEGSISLALRSAGKRKQILAKTAGELFEGCVDHKVLFPRLVNTAPLQIGEELWCFKPAPAPVDKKAAHRDILLSKLSKAVADIKAAAPKSFAGQPNQHDL